MRRGETERGQWADYVCHAGELQGPHGPVLALAPVLMTRPAGRAGGDPPVSTGGGPGMTVGREYTVSGRRPNLQRFRDEGSDAQEATMPRRVRDLISCKRRHGGRNSGMQCAPHARRNRPVAPRLVPRPEHTRWTVPLDRTEYMAHTTPGGPPPPSQVTKDRRLFNYLLPRRELPTAPPPRLHAWQGSRRSRPTRHGAVGHETKGAPSRRVTSQIAASCASSTRVVGKANFRGVIWHRPLPPLIHPPPRSTRPRGSALAASVLRSPGADSPVPAAPASSR